MLGNFLIMLSADFFSKINFYRHFKNYHLKKSFRNTIRESNSLETDQEQHSVGQDLGPNFSQRLSADDKNHR